MHKKTADNILQFLIYDLIGNFNYKPIPVRAPDLPAHVQSNIALDPES